MVAVTYGANYTKAFLTTPPTMIEQGETGGKVKCITDTYTLLASMGIGDLVVMGGGKLPKGAKVVDAYIKAPSMSTDGIFSLGYNASPEATPLEAAAPAAFVLADAGGQAVFQRPVAGNTGILKELLGDVEIVLGCTEATTATSGKVEILSLIHI